MDTKSRESSREDAKISSEPKCDYLSIPVAVDYERDKVYEGIPWCNLSDNPCFKDTGNCDEWNELIKEITNGA